VVWNVFAAPEFSTRPKDWCFPFAGCVEYRGYFREEAARAFGKRLRERGFDVFVGGVPAYSTLGYLDDPVLNTFIGYPESEVARLIFHELAHQVVYARGDTTFNESFATAVELEGVRRWIAVEGTAEAQQAFDQAQARKRDFLLLVERYRNHLAALFDQDLPAEEKRLRKREFFMQMRQDYAKLKQSWGGFSGYDGWFSQPLNNAQLASVAIYTQLVPAFQRILTAQQGDMKRFYIEVERIAGLPHEKRVAELDPHP
jgi:predicted aminopeptidase